MKLTKRLVARSRTLRRPIMLVAAAVVAWSGAAVGSARAQGTYWPWCVEYRDGSYNCGFANYQQCLATAIRLAEERRCAHQWMQGKAMRGGDYLDHYALPNFHFHLTTAYAILRHNGARLGKSDFLGSVPFV